MALTVATPVTTRPARRGPARRHCATPKAIGVQVPQPSGMGSANNQVLYLLETCGHHAGLLATCHSPGCYQTRLRTRPHSASFYSSQPLSKDPTPQGPLLAAIPSSTPQRSGPTGTAPGQS